MRSRPPSRWVNPKGTVGLLLFAQRVEEMLFDYTLDTYKAPVLNTHYRCVELIDAIAAVRNRELKPQALDSIAHELADSLNSDDVALDLLGPISAEVRLPGFWDTR